ncbi:MAG: DUF6456 domain-containing protein [Pseudomonadota bacterium]
MADGCDISPTMLDRYRQRDELDARQYCAGDALHRLYVAAGRSPTMSLELVGVGDTEKNAHARKADAWVELNQALRAVGQRLSPVLLHVCLADGAASAWARKNGHDPRGGLTLLRVALDSLADYFRHPGGGR